MSELPEHVARNRADWDALRAGMGGAGPARLGARGAVVGHLHRARSRSCTCCPTTSTGSTPIELGCGTAYVSAWLARRGARPVGIDNSERQLATARLLQEEFGIDFPLVHGNAEATPFEDASFDFAISEYGASIWCDPYKWIPEAARLLRPGGRLVFLVDTPLRDPVRPRTPRASPPASGCCARTSACIAWSGPRDDSVEFHLPHGELIALLRRAGFEIEELIEVQPPEDATTRFPHATLEWARRWPYEEIWKVRKRG